MLRRFVGVARLEKAGGAARQKRQLQKDGKTSIPDPEPFFKGIYPTRTARRLESLLKRQKGGQEVF